MLLIRGNTIAFVILLLFCQILNAHSLKIEYLTHEVKIDHKDNNNPNLINHSLIYINNDKPLENINKMNQIWFITGGPGLDGNSIVEFAKVVIEELKETHVAIIPNHRGTGNSTYINCPGTYEIEKCIEYAKENLGHVLPFYTVDQTAYDIIDALKKFKTSGKISLYGVNYGTYIINRIMQFIKLEDNIKIEHIVLDGMVPSDIVEYELQPHHLNSIGLQLLSDCSKSSFICETIFGRSPEYVLNSLWNKLLHGNYDCLQKLNTSPSVIREKWTKSLLTEEEMILVPAILKRLLRCSSQDIKELEFWLSSFNPKYKDEKNILIYNHIRYSELYTIDTPKNLSRDLYLFSYEEEKIQSYYDWPKYSVDSKTHRKWADNYKNVLIIHGEYDTHSNLFYSIYAKDIIEKNSAKTQFIKVPYGFNQSPSTKERRPKCVNNIVLQFLSSTKEIDSKCLDELQMDFEGQNKISKKLSKDSFNVDELWGDLDFDPPSYVPDAMTWEGYVLFATFIALVIIVATVFILLVIKSTKRPDQTRGANHYFQQD